MTPEDWLKLSEYHVRKSPAGKRCGIFILAVDLWHVENAFKSIGPFYTEKTATEFCERANTFTASGSRLGNHMQIEYRVPA